MAGAGLLVMAILAGLSFFIIDQQVFVEGNARATASNLDANRSAFTFAAVSFAIVAFLDVVVGVALWKFFNRTAPQFARVSGILRIAYAVVLAASLTGLFSARTATEPAEVLDGISLFQRVWSAGLFIFGIHLVTIAMLLWMHRAAPRWLGVLVAISGLGYILDSVIEVAFEDSGFSISAFTFVGEVVLLIWLLWRGGYAEKSSQRPATE